ncbi:DUF1684 domain-containing protein [Microlunatus elymi]|nr:DUF1684 domain-containing protein [Microlunatus elymi]
MTVIDTGLVDHERSWHELRAERFRQLSRPDSPLAQTGLYWLTESPLRFPEVPGQWSVQDDQLLGYADEGDSLRRPVSQELITGTIRQSVGEAGSVIIAEYGRLDETARRIELIKRTASLALRVYDPQAVSRTAFRGVPAFAFDPGWVIRAEFRRFGTPRTITVAGAQPGLRHRQEAIGEVSFRRGGVEHRLTVVTGARTSILFSDVTSGAETAPWRVLPVVVGDDGSEVVLDFNQAVDLPYAFNNFGTCPQPLAENRMDLAVTAGEQAPYPVDLDQPVSTTSLDSTAVHAA